MPNLNHQTEYWNSVAWEKTFTLPFDLTKFSGLVPRDAHILDYGCGYGRLSVMLHDAGYRNVVGVDISDEMLKRAWSEHPELDLRVLEGSGIPFEDSSFDAVVLFAVLTCVPTDDGQKKIINEIFRVLRPGGLLYATDYYLQEQEPYPERYSEFVQEFGTYGIFRLPEGGVYRHNHPDWIKELLAGFEQIELTETEAMTMNLHLAKIFRYIGRKT